MSSTSILNTNGSTRVTGLISGLDIDSIVENMITAEKAKLNKLQQKEQLATWKQENYREVISELNTFADAYFSLTSSKSLILQGNYMKYKTLSNSSSVTATAGSSAVSGTHSIIVNQLAEAAMRVSGGRVTKEVQGTTTANFVEAQGKSFIIEVDGTKKTISLDSSVTNIDSLQELIDKAIGENKVVISAQNSDGSGALVFSAGDSGVQKITLSNEDSDGALSSLGFDDDSILANRISTTDTLANISKNLNQELIFNADGQVKLTINGVEFNFDKDDTLSEIMQEINKSDAGVTLSYDELKDKLVLISAETGAGGTLEVTEDGSNFLTALLDEVVAGKDARIVFDGQSILRSSNNITVEGVTYQLKATSAEAATITVERDTTSIYDNIVDFVTDYNNLIASLNSSISEEYDYDYPPLTDDQKAEMTETEIANWEKKAKNGILAKDSLISKCVSRLRDALIDPVSGTSLTLSDLGITTGTYDEKGKLYFDETTLKKAIEDDPEGIMRLFAQQSESYPGTIGVRSLGSSERQVRYNEEGLAYRFNDIIQDYISTYRDNSGLKGMLIEKAGLKGDLTEYQNSLTKEIKDYQTRIDKELERLSDVEERLYEKFSAMESYISTMNIQLSALLSSISSES